MPVSPSTPDDDRHACGRLALGVALLVAGTRWALLRAYGSDVPYWDEWLADAVQLFKPWRAGALDCSTLFAPHNEHRIALTRLWELGWFTLNRERWDPLLVQTANVLLAAAASGVLAFHAARATPPRHPAWAWLIVLATLLVPFGYSNLLIAFQSQFAFLLLLAVAALGLWSRLEITPRRIVLGLLCAVAALFTTGSGVLVAATLAIVAADRAVRLPASRRHWAAAAGAGVVVLAGFLLRAPVEEGGDFPSRFAAAGRYLAWPAGNFVTLVADWPATARYLPSAIGRWPDADAPWIASLAMFLARHPGLTVGVMWIIGLSLHAPALRLLLRARLRDTCPFPAMLSLWALLNIAAMAFARTEYAIVPPRYQDILAAGILASVLAWLHRRDGEHCHAPSRWRRWLAVFWPAAVASALAVTAAGIFAVQLPRKRAENRAATHLVQRYLVTHDVRIFFNQPPNHVPWPNQERALAAVLDDPAVREFLPRSLLPPTELPPAPGASRFAAVVRSSGLVVALLGGYFVCAGFLGPRVLNRPKAAVPAP